MLQISDNPLITEGNAQAICTNIAYKIVGLKFRILDVTCFPRDFPTLGKYAIVNFRNKEYHTYINDFVYTLNTDLQVKFNAETPLYRITNKGDTATTTLKKATDTSKNSYIKI